MLGVVAFGAYAWLCAPGPYWLDSQELAAAGVRFGIAHPTGFAAYLVLVRLAAFLPIGELAFRVHLLSAATAALAVALVSRLAARLAGEDAPARVGAAFAGLLVAVSATFFRQATVAEVYAPTAALLLLTLLGALRVAEGGQAARAPGLALALVAGIAAAGSHVSYRMLLGLPLAILYLGRLRRGARWVRATPALGALGALATLAYLPLRSASGRVAALDWGHPRTAAALWEHATAARIREAFDEEIFSTVPEVVAENGRRMAALVEADLGVLALLGAVAGGIALLGSRRGRVAGALLCFVAAGDLAYSVWVNPMGIEDRQNGVPLVVALAVLFGVGVAAAGRRFGRAAPWVAAAVGTIAFVPAVLDSFAAKVAVRRVEAPRAWAEAALGAAPARAIALAQSDSLAANLLWLGEVEGARPDVAVLVRQHLWDLPRDGAVLAAAGVRFEAARPSEALAALARTGRAILWEVGTDRMPPELRIVPFPASLETIRRVFSRGSADEPTRRAHAVALTALGRLAFVRGALAEARRLFAAARAADPDHAASGVNLAVVADREGDVAGAARLVESVLARRPNHPVALVNAVRYHLRLGDDDAARRLAERAIRVAPRRADAWALLGVVEARAGRREAARRAFERALAIDPDEPDARANLAKLGGG